MNTPPLPTIPEAEPIDREHWDHIYEQIVKIRPFEEGLLTTAIAVSRHSSWLMERTAANMRLMQIKNLNG